MFWRGFAEDNKPKDKNILTRLSRWRSREGLDSYWNKATYDWVQWEALEGSLIKKNRVQQTSICKYVHGWQNVGHQKRLYNQNTREALCLFGCEQLEIQHHYLYCQEPAAVRLRQDGLQKLFLRMEKAKTDPLILHIFITHITDHLTHSRPNPPKGYRPHPMPPIYFNPEAITETMENAICCQEMIGWNQLLRGKLVKTG